MALTKFQRFVPMRVARTEIANAPYNPRKISRYARKKLQEVLKAIGLIEAIVWNKRTGNAVGGHQRLACIDALEKGQDYELDVNAVDMSPEEEIAANIELNNPSLQGEWDLPLLSAALKTPGIDIGRTGFDRMEIEVLFGDIGNDPAMSKLFADASAPEEVQQSIALLEQAADMRPSKQTEPPTEPPPEGPPKRKAHDNLRAWAEKADADPDQDTNFVVSFVFNDSKRKHRFLWAIQEANHKFGNGERLATKLGIDLDKPAPDEAQTATAPEPSEEGTEAGQEPQGASSGTE